MATPVGTSARSDALQRHIDGGDEVGTGIARVGIVQLGRMFGVEALDQDLVDSGSL